MALIKPEQIPDEVSRKIITHAQLLETLSYDPESGVFTWLKSRRNGSIPAGTIAGGKNVNGYVRIEIDGRIYQAHRLAWLYVTGSWPNNLIDHIDGCRANNCFSNLREATPAENIWNCKLPTSNTSGIKGVSWDRHNKRWKAAIRVNGTDVNLGVFRTKPEAISAVKEARHIYHKEFANHGSTDGGRNDFG